MLEYGQSRKIFQTVKQKKSFFSNKVYWFLFVSTVCLSIILRFYDLSSKSLWIDEQWTHVISSKGPISMIGYLIKMADRPPLHLLLTSIAILFLDNEFFLRLIPAIFGVLGVIIFYYVAKKIFSEKEAIIAAFIISISPYHINYSQEATTYTIFLFFSMLSILMFFLSLERKKGIWWGGFVLSSTLNIYSSYFGIFLLAAFMLTIATLWTASHFMKNSGYDNHISMPIQEPALISNKTFIQFLVSIGLIIFFYIPWMPVLYSSLSKYKGGDAASANISPSMLINIFKEFSGSGYSFTYILILLFFAGFISLFKNRIREYIFISWCIVTPFLTIFILKPEYNFFSRYVIFILPLYLSCVSKGITVFGSMVSSRFKIKELYITGLLVISISVPLVSSVWRYYKLERRDWRSAAALIEKEAISGDIVAIEPSFLYYPFFYYLNIDKNIKMNLIDPLNPAPLVNLTLNNSKEVAVCHFMTLMKSGLLRKYKRLWYILTVNAPPDWIDRKFRLIKKFPGYSKGWDISIYLVEIDNLFSNG